MSKTQPPRDADPIRDLPDFVLRWQEFRPLAEAIAQRSTLEASARDVVAWLIQLADKITVQDLSD